MLIFFFIACVYFIYCVMSRKLVVVTVCEVLDFIVEMFELNPRILEF